MRLVNRAPLASHQNVEDCASAGSHRSRRDGIQYARLRPLTPASRQLAQTRERVPVCSGARGKRQCFCSLHPSPHSHALPARTAVVYKSQQPSLVRAQSSTPDPKKKNLVRRHSSGEHAFLPSRQDRKAINDANKVRVWTRRFCAGSRCLTQTRRSSHALPRSRLACRKTSSRTLQATGCPPPGGTN